MPLIMILLINLSDPFISSNILSFADHLYKQEDYIAALNEYRRYQFLSDSIPDDIPEKIIDCLVNLEKYSEAIIECNNIKDELKKEFLKGTVFFAAQQYDSSRIHLMNIQEPYKKSAKEIVGLTYAYEFRFSEADKYLKLPPGRPKYKKPVLGAICALVPGGGHWYCGRFGDGMFSFFLIGTTALLSYYYHHENEDLKYGICLSATGLFYIANLYGGVNAVHNYNYYQNEKYLREILE